ncbi:MAG: hypothetical protein V3574_00535 [Candidatus Moraniibacteriota bacterium]
MKKITIVIFGFALVLLAGAFYFFNKKTPSQTQEQDVLEETYAVSVEYLSLRQQTENVLEKAESFTDYDSWKAEMEEVTKNWKNLEQKSSELEKTANEIANEKIGMDIIPSALAYDKEEINKIIDSAPMGKKIMTLANHLGTDAKHAQLILNQAQDETSREAYGEEGDVFEKCEQNSMRIKNGCKVAGFVGGVVLTGGASAVVASGALATTTTVVVGADLVLEVTDDEARIALGDKNKVSEMVSSVRTVTEPAAAILTLTNIPGNLSKGIDQLSAISFGADQVKSVIQDEKVLGISIKTDEKGEAKAEIAGLAKEELSKWREENKAIKSNESAEEIINNAKVATEKKVADKESGAKQVEEKEEVTEKSYNSTENSVAGSGWEGELSSMSGGDNEKRTIDFDFTLNQDGSVSSDSFKKWKQEGDRIKLYGEDESIGYYEFKIGKKDLLLTKIVIGDEIIQPGEEYMGGIAPGGFLKRKSDSKSENEGSQSNKNAISLAEYNEMDDKGILKNISSVEKYLGKPDVKTTDDKGRIIYIYYDLVEYESGNLGSVKMAFYNEEDYKAYIKNMGGSWESNKENWDESGGGVRATSEIKSADTFKQQYGD